MQNLTQNTGDPERKGEDNEGIFLDCMGNESTLNKQKSCVTQARKINLLHLFHEVQEQ